MSAVPMVLLVMQNIVLVHCVVFDAVLTEKGKDIIIIRTLNLEILR